MLIACKIAAGIFKSFLKIHVGEYNPKHRQSNYRQSLPLKSDKSLMVLVWGGAETNIFEVHFRQIFFFFQQIFEQM